MIQLGVQLDQNQLNQAQQMLREIPGGMNQAVRRAGNETFAEARTQMVKLIRQHINIKASDLKKHIPKAAPMRWIGGRIEGKLVVPWARRLGLMYFGAKQTAQGVSYAINKGGRKKIAGAFIGGPRLGSNVFARVGPRKKRMKKPIAYPTTKRQFAWPDLPIEKLEGASAWGVLLKQDLVKVIRAEMQRDFHKNLMQRVDALLLKQQGKIKF